MTMVNGSQWSGANANAGARKSVTGEGEEASIEYALCTDMI